MIIKDVGRGCQERDSGEQGHKKITLKNKDIKGQWQDNSRNVKKRIRTGKNNGMVCQESESR